MERLLVLAHTLMTGSDSIGTLQPGAMIVEDGIIRSIGHPQELRSQGEFSEIVGDLDSHVALPGLVNGHYHGLRPYRLRTLKAPLELLLAQSRRRRLPPMTVDELRDHSMWTAVKLLQTGVTAFVDCFPTDPQHDDLGLGPSIEAYVSSGIRVAVCIRCSDRSAFTYEDDDAFVDRLPEPLRTDVGQTRRPFNGQRFFDVAEAISREYDGRDDRIRIGIGPTGVQWCSDDLLRRVKTFAEERDAPVQIHLLESPFQAAAAALEFGQTAVEHLGDLGLLGEAYSFAHAIWLTPEDRIRLRDAGSAIIHNPGSNLSAGDGIARVPEMIADGCRVGIGLDSSGFEQTADMFREMRLALLVGRRPGWHPQQLSAAQVIAAATASAAYALRMPTKTGTLVPGMGADVCLLRRDVLLASPYSDADQAPEELILEAATPGAVDKVLVGGRLEIDGGMPVGVDMSALASRVRESVERYLPLLEPADEEFVALEPFIHEYYAGMDLGSLGIDANANLVDEAALLRPSRKGRQTPPVDADAKPIS